MSTDPVAVEAAADALKLAGLFDEALALRDCVSRSTASIAREAIKRARLDVARVVSLARWAQLSAFATTSSEFNDRFNAADRALDALGYPR